TDAATGAAKKEAEVIMTAAALGFAAALGKDDQPVQFDMDPLDLAHPGGSEPFQRAVDKIDTAVAEYLKARHLEARGKLDGGRAAWIAEGGGDRRSVQAGRTAAPAIDLRAGAVPEGTGPLRQDQEQRSIHRPVHGSGRLHRICRQ